MARLHSRLLNSTNALIAMLISLLGFSSSCKKEENGPIYMYGSPSAHFIVKGKIESALTQQLIPEIIVEMRIVKETENGEPDIRLIGTSFSDPIGNYSSMDDSYPDDRTYQIKFTDTDGALNGEYETLDTTIVFKDPEFTGGHGSWYKGVAEKVVNIKLKSKK